MRKVGVPSIPDELRDEIEAKLVDYVRLITRERELKAEAQTSTAEMRYRMHDIFGQTNRKVARLARRRARIVAEIIKTWDEHFPDLTTAEFPFARVSRAIARSIEVLDKRAVINALDRLKRLDLVEYVIDEKGLRKVVSSGALDRLQPEALKVTEKGELRVSPKKEIDDVEA